MPESFDSRFFRNACGQFLTGVTIVTTRGENGEPLGITANSFTSVSLDPPLVLVSLDKGLGSFDAFYHAKGYAVHVLSEEQEALSNLFAKRGADKFKDVIYEEGIYDIPVMKNAIAVFECETHQKIDAGDHCLFIGNVKKAEINNPDKRPLGFLRGSYTVPEQHQVIEE